MPRGSRPGERRGGRKPGTPNKATAEIKDAAKAYTKLALSTLVAVAKKSESDAARVAAANGILDRAYGKPAQALTGEGGEGPVRVEITVATGIARSADGS